MSNHRLKQPEPPRSQPGAGSESGSIRSACGEPPPDPSPATIEDRQLPETLPEAAAEILSEDSVLRCGDLAAEALESLFARFGGDRLTIVWVADGESIPGSFWGDPEAGIQGTTLFVRADTPVHSALHEGCHLLCADPDRRQEVDTNIGGDYDEENAVCYLQILLADSLAGVGEERLCADMDAWGYSFRLGSTRRWFDEDAEDARDWLIREGLLSAAGELTWKARS